MARVVCFPVPKLYSNMKKHRLHSSAALAVLLPLASAQATTYTFTGNTTGTTTWSSGTNWSATPVSAATTDLVFGTGQTMASGVVAVTTQDITTAPDPFLLNSLTTSYSGSGTEPNIRIQTGPLSFVSDGATTPSIALNSTGAVPTQLVFLNAVNFANDTSIGGASSARFDGALSNTGGATVTKTGAGTLRIASDNPGYTGNFTVSAGVLQLGNADITGDIGSGTINLAGGNFTVRRGGVWTLNNTISGTGNFTVQLNNNAVITIGKANTYDGLTTLSPTGANRIGRMKLGIDNGLSTTSVLTISNNGTSVQTFDLNGFNQTLGGLSAGSASANATNTKVALGIGTLTINDSGDRIFRGEISGAGNVVKQGAGTWTLNSVNTFTGTTTISAGAITLGTGGSINGSSRITVGSGATLNNNNAAALNAPLALTEGATLGGTGAFAPSSLRVVADLGNGYSAITAGSSLTKAGNLTFDLSGLTGITTQVSYSLFSGTPLGSFTGVSIGATALDSTDSNATFSGTVGDFTYLFTNSLNQLMITPIPEPASTAALLGLGAIGVTLARRRRTT